MKITHADIRPHTVFPFLLKKTGGKTGNVVLEASVTEDASIIWHRDRLPQEEYISEPNGTEAHFGDILETL